MTKVSSTRTRIVLTKQAMMFFRETGRLGGKQRAANMTAEQRSASARKASATRWLRRA